MGRKYRCGGNMAVLSKVPGCRVSGSVIALLASRQDRIRDMPLDLLHFCGDLQVLRERGEALGATQKSRRLWVSRAEDLRRGEVHRR